MSVNRRSFLKTGAAVGGGLLVGFQLPVKGQAQTASPLKLNAFVKVGTDDTVTLAIDKSEMGQGTVTSLSQLLAEELECDWKKIRTEFPGVEPVYGSPMMGAYGSLSIRTSWQPLRQAGAAAREMLVEAAAQRWNVNKSQCRAENSTVVNTATGAKLTYGALAEAAAKLPAPTGITLKTAAQYKVIGTSPKRLDTPAKVNGSIGFGLDVRRPGMLYASLERCPVFEGKVASFDATKAMAVPGVKKVVRDFERRGRDRRQYLERFRGPQGARHQVGRGQVGQRIDSRATARNGRVWPPSRACRCARQAMPRAPSPAPRRKSKRCTKRRIFRTLPWSR